MLERALIGAILALAIALAARRVRSLSPDGVVPAVVVGTLAAAAGWMWAVVLIVYFASSSALSHLGRAQKEQRTSRVASKGGERDAAQVAANGGVFAIAAVFMLLHPDATWVALGIGSLAVSAADTWATEIGTLYGGAPRSILTFETIACGLSGGVTPVGTLASAAGGAFVAIVACALGATSRTGFAIAVGGFSGALVDSILGATVQARRWCPKCRAVTERSVHDCGTLTTANRGIRWLGNDAVNLVSGVAGGLLAAWVAR
ncbi:MAG TPA: DUF92 domain-containing protein [Gemmatimonadaceae bacterium]|nr:DUF92 domain-containing protein [Gemmatimonadaceae bacterium]